MHQFHEDTNVFAYFIIKTMWLLHIDRFLQWCSTHCRNRSRVRAHAAAVLAFPGEDDKGSEAMNAFLFECLDPVFKRPDARAVQLLLLASNEERMMSTEDSLKRTLRMTITGEEDLF